MDLAKKKLEKALSEYGASFDYTALKQDASSRVYFRCPEFLAVVYTDKSAPEAGGGKSLSPDKAFAILQKEYLKIDVCVPKLIWVNSEEDVYFLEDFGNQHLADLSSEELLPNFKKAIEAASLITKLDISPVGDRSLSRQVILTELQEILDYTALGKIDGVTGHFESLCLKIESFDYCPQHRDFHAWNILVRNGQLGVIDFQDSFMAPRGYDLASLLHDRSTDSLLGSHYVSLLRFGLDAFGIEEKQLLYILLQRDLKVIGRFHKLASKGKPDYLQWVPSTLTRVKKTLSTLGLTDLRVMFSESLDEA